MMIALMTQKILLLTVLQKYNLEMNRGKERLLKIRGDYKKNKTRKRYWNI